MSTTQPESAYDVFISYSHRDQTWVRDKLLPGLEKAGLKVCIDYRDFRVGMPIVKEMERAVLTSRHTLLVLTPAYLESAWTDFEALMASTLDPGSQQARLLPLLLKPCDLPIRIKYLGCADFTVSYDLASSWRRLLSALRRQRRAPRPPRYEIPEAALERYYEQIVKQYGWIRIFGQTTPKPLKEVFTDVYMLDKPTAFSRFDPDALREHLWEQDRGIPFRYGERLPADQLLSRGSKFFILGKPGAGKTTFLRHLAVREAQRGEWGPCLGKVPIFVPLKQFSESRKSLLDFIMEQFAVCHFLDAAPFVKRLLTEGKALVLFDGLDEVAGDAEARSDRRGKVTELIERFSRQYDRCHIVVTSRIAATQYMFDPAFIYLELADFAPDQVKAFVRNWFWDESAADKGAALAERMLAEWGRPEHEGIRDLGRSPLLLTLLCLNYAETRNFPARRVEIYQEALGALLKMWDSSRQIQRVSLYKSLSLGRKQQMFSRIAYDGFTQQEILFRQADLEARLKAYLADVPELPVTIDIDAGAVLAAIIEQHGIFAEQSRGLYSFAHLTFQEYYVAMYLTENPAPDALKHLMARVSGDKWREVFLLTASLLPDATPFLTAFEAALNRLIASRPRLVDWLRWNGEQAARSQAAFTQPATRCRYADAVYLPAPDQARTGDSIYIPDFARALGRALDRALDLARDLDRDLALDLALDRAQASIRHHAHGFAYGPSVVELVRSAEEYCRRRGEASLAEALSALEIPLKGAPRAAWDRFAAQLEEITASHAGFLRFRQLEAEREAFARASAKSWRFDTADIDAFEAYMSATSLFYNCLQLARTSDRRAFEDRILLPPQLNG